MKTLNFFFYELDSCLIMKNFNILSSMLQSRLFFFHFNSFILSLVFEFLNISRFFKDIIQHSTYIF